MRRCLNTSGSNLGARRSIWATSPVVATLTCHQSVWKWFPSSFPPPQQGKCYCFFHVTRRRAMMQLLRSCSAFYVLLLGSTSIRQRSGRGGGVSGFFEIFSCRNSGLMAIWHRNRNRVFYVRRDYTFAGIRIFLNSFVSWNWNQIDWCRNVFMVWSRAWISGRYIFTINCSIFRSRNFWNDCLILILRYRWCPMGYTKFGHLRHHVTRGNSTFMFELHWSVYIRMQRNIWRMVVCHRLSSCHDPHPWRHYLVAWMISAASNLTTSHFV